MPLNSLQDMRRHDCDIITLGQYLQPSTDQLPVDRYVLPVEFGQLKMEAEKLGE